MFETQKLKCLRPPHPTLLPCNGCKTPEEYAPSLFLGQLQPEYGEPFPDRPVEMVRLLFELECRHEIISETHQIRLTSTGWFDLLLKPQVEHKVKIDVAQHRRDRA